MNKARIAEWKNDIGEWCPCCKSRKKMPGRFLCEECQEWFDKQRKIEDGWDNFLASGGE